MEDSVDLDLEIKNGILSGSEDYTLLMNEAILYINPNDAKLQNKDSRGGSITLSAMRCIATSLGCSLWGVRIALWGNGILTDAREGQ